MRTFLLNTIKVMSDSRIRPTENFKLSDGLKRRLKIDDIKARTFAFQVQRFSKQKGQYAVAYSLSAKKECT